jgi:hypothetical protein
MTFKKWFIQLTNNEKVAFFGTIGCGVGAVLLALGQTGLGICFLFGGFIGILFIANSDT